MKRLLTAIVVFTIGLITVVSHAQETRRVDQAWVSQNLTAMPLAFTQNIGQWDERALFRADAGKATMWISTDGVYYQFTRRIPLDDERQMSRLRVGGRRPRLPPMSWMIL